MKDGFITVACGAPPLRLADCAYNAEQTFQMMRSAEKAGVKVLVLPELGLTGYTCGDLFFQDALYFRAALHLCASFSFRFVRPCIAPGALPCFTPVLLLHCPIKPCCCNWHP